MKLIKNLFIMICNLVFLSRCTDRAKEEYSPSSFFKQNTAKQNEGLIVFVHGIFGDAKDTWTNEQTGAYFPELVSNDSVFAGYDIFTYGFASPKLNIALTIDELGEDLRSTFDDQNFSRYSKIVLVCHSMGGLVSRSFLIKYREKWAHKIKLIYYFSTPGSGSQIASLARSFSKNEQLENLQIENGDRYLANQSRAWYAVQSLIDIPAYCAYEKQATSISKIVEFSSASSICNRPLDPINENHINIVKPKDIRAKSYIVFRNAFKATISNNAINEVKSNPEPKKNGNASKSSTYQLRDVNDRPLNVGDFYSFDAIVNGHVPETQRNFYLIAKINKNDDCIFTYSTAENEPGWAISTHVLVGQRTKTVIRRKIEPQWLKTHYPEQYRILMNKAMLYGLVQDGE
ncbi:esterase/lipase family protein [Salmonirosea aquatica]|uniref:GPI inositol-deacylase PGAP1-like alpha/beta domain-containing protein n=1 Tax=Salmonirosea aquatica TaxID=2654236 RepID=A0A7C9BK28_9BACT|nr:hypothetical protein [Cytophagaceae bacterium SJW1-29]